MYYRQCDICGSHLDPNEKCDCQSNNQRSNKAIKEKPAPERKAVQNEKK